MTDTRTDILKGRLYKKGKAWKVWRERECILYRTSLVYTSASNAQSKVNNVDTTRLYTRPDS